MSEKNQLTPPNLVRWYFRNQYSVNRFLKKRDALPNHYMMLAFPIFLADCQGDVLVGDVIKQLEVSALRVIATGAIRHQSLFELEDLMGLDQVTIKKLRMYFESKGFLKTDVEDGQIMELTPAGIHAMVTSKPFEKKIASFTLVLDGISGMPLPSYLKSTIKSKLEVEEARNTRNVFLKYHSIEITPDIINKGLKKLKPHELKELDIPTIINIEIKSFKRAFIFCHMLQFSDDTLVLFDEQQGNPISDIQLNKEELGTFFDKMLGMDDQDLLIDRLAKRGYKIFEISHINNIWKAKVEDPTGKEFDFEIVRGSIIYLYSNNPMVIREKIIRRIIENLNLKITFSEYWKLAQQSIQEVLEEHMVEISPTRDNSVVHLRQIPSLDEIYDYLENRRWHKMTVFVRRLMSLLTAKENRVKPALWVAHS